MAYSTDIDKMVRGARLRLIGILLLADLTALIETWLIVRHPLWQAKLIFLGLLLVVLAAVLFTWRIAVWFYRICKEADCRLSGNIDRFNLEVARAYAEEEDRKILSGKESLVRSWAKHLDDSIFGNVERELFERLETEDEDG